MKISMWTSFLYGRPFESIVRSLRKAGFDSADLSAEHLLELLDSARPLEQARRWRELADGLGLPLLQTHLALESDLTLQPNESGEQLDFLKRQLELAMFLEIPAAVVHVSQCSGIDQPTADADRPGTGLDPEREEHAVWYLTQLSAFLKGSPTRLALENLFFAELRAKNLVSLIELAGKPPELGICLDTGHLHCSGGDQIEFLETAAPYLIALHISDNTGVTDYHMLPLGRGTIDWRRFMPKLKSIGYPGIFNLEASGENSPVYPEILDAKLDYAAKVVQTLMKME